MRGLSPWPRSAFWQFAFLICGALFVAQLVGAVLFMNEQTSLRLFQQYEPAVSRFASIAARAIDLNPSLRKSFLTRQGGDGERFYIDGESSISRRHYIRQRNLEDHLRRALEQANIPVTAVEASSFGLKTSPAGPDKPPAGPMVDHGPPKGPPPCSPETSSECAWDPDAPGRPPAPSGLPGERPPPPPLGGPDGPSLQMLALDFSVQLLDGSWLNAEMKTTKLPPNFFGRLILAELVLLALVIGVALFAMDRLLRPLRTLASAAEGLGSLENPPSLPTNGPLEVQTATRAFNAMTERVVALLKEKDRMLGALGHDLRTPIASLRIRVESVEPESERAHMIETIEDLARMTEEILDLARLGHSREPFGVVDLTSLVDAVIEDFYVLGENVILRESPRAPVRMQPTLVKRLLRNLIENAVKFGKRATVSIEQTREGVVLTVDDEGPGIAEADLASVLEPFVRLETSRSQKTGGIGLGLSIARAIAQSQGATLSLRNLPSGGLRASVFWPAISSTHQRGSAQGKSKRNL